MFLCSLNVFAQYDHYDYGYSEWTGWHTFGLILLIAYTALIIFLVIRWLEMAKDVKTIRKSLDNIEKKYIEIDTMEFEYLIACGETEIANKKALKHLVKLLIEIYNNEYVRYSASYMDKTIEHWLGVYNRLNLTMPDYVTSGEKFIDYMNALTGRNVNK